LGSITESNDIDLDWRLEEVASGNYRPIPAAPTAIVSICPINLLPYLKTGFSRYSPGRQRSEDDTTKQFVFRQSYTGLTREASDDPHAWIVFRTCSSFITTGNHGNGVRLGKDFEYAGYDILIVPRGTPHRKITAGLDATLMMIKSSAPAK
jgi:hypothetical protein